MNPLDTFSLEGKTAVVTGGGGNYGKSIVIFPASNASAYLTGTNIPVDGGYTCK